MTAREHWESIYERKAPDAVSWYAPHLTQSLRYVQLAAPRHDAAIIDVGSGESTLVDDLFATGYRNITALDISPKALSVTKARLGARAVGVKWLAADILDIDLPSGAIDVWHDRAVFHFLTTEERRHRYLSQVLKALRPGGHAIIGTFGPDGPTQCSGLEVSRYSGGELHQTFGARFELLETSTEMHTTPRGTAQQFTYCLCRLSES